MAARTAFRFTDSSPTPLSCAFTTRSTSTGATRWKRPSTATVSIGWLKAHMTAALAQPAAASTPQPMAR